MLLALPLLVGCESDDKSIVDPYDIDPNTPCELSYSLDGAYRDAETGNYSAPQNGYVKLANASTGLYTQSWTISSADCQFMVDGFDPASDWASQADITKGIASTRATEYLFCPTLGSYTLTLNCTFVNEVAGATYSESAKLWIYKKIFQLNVEECPALKAVAKIYDTDGKSEITETSLTVNPGKTLIFKNESEGLDLTAAWSVKVDGVEQEFDIADDGSYTFTDEGVYSDFKLMVESSNILYGDANKGEMTLPNSVSVESIPIDVTALSIDIASSVAHSSTQLPELKVTLNGVVGDITDVAADFALKVLDYNGTEQAVSITSAELDSTKGALILKLGAKIYENDVVTLSYTQPADAEGQIADEYNDENVLESFAEKSVSIVGGIDLLSSNTGYDFEAGSNLPNNGWTKFIKDNNNSQNSVTVEISDAVVHSGSQSTHFVVPADLTFLSFVYSFVAPNTSPATSVEKGNYMIKHWVYVDESTTAAMDDIYVVKYCLANKTNAWFDHTAAAAGTIECRFPTTKGEWCQSSIEVSYSEPMEVKYRFDFVAAATNKGYLSGSSFYIDNVEIIPIR